MQQGIRESDPELQERIAHYEDTLIRLSQAMEEEKEVREGLESDMNKLKVKKKINLGR